MQEPDHEIESEQPKGRLLGPRVGSEVYRPSGSFTLRWRVWEVGPGGRFTKHEVAGSAFTRRGARRAVTRAIRGFQREIPAQETWAAGPTKHGRPHAPSRRVAATVSGRTSDGQHDVPEPVGRVTDRRTSTDAATEAPDARLATILARVEELQRSIAGVVERLDASTEALGSPDHPSGASTDPADREPTHPRVARDA